MKIDVAVNIKDEQILEYIKCLPPEDIHRFIENMLPKLTEYGSHIEPRFGLETVMNILNKTINAMKYSERNHVLGSKDLIKQLSEIEKQIVDIEREYWNRQ